MNHLYIYNVEQSNFYIKNKVNPVEVGVNPKSNTVWFKFIKEETFDVYLKWLDRGDKNNTQKMGKMFESTKSVCSI